MLPGAFGGWQLLSSGSGTAGLGLSRADAGPFSSSDVTLPGDLTFKVSGQSVVSVGTVTWGTVRAERGPVTELYEAGEVFVASFPGADFVCHTSNARLHVLTVPASSLAQAAGLAADGQSQPLRFLSLVPASPARLDQWKLTAGYAATLLTNPEVAASPLVIATVARLLAATALAVFPNTVLSGPAAADRRGAGTAALRRAVSFIDDHAQADITVA